jgi:hypothetical protein
MSNPLEEAIAQARQKRGWDKPTAETAPAEETPGKSFRVKCVNCGAVHRMAEDDLEPWETDDETSETGATDDESLSTDDDSDGDDDSEELDAAGKSRFVAQLLNRKRNR